MRTITILILSAGALFAQTANPTAAQTNGRGGARPPDTTDAAELSRVRDTERDLEKKLAELRIRYSDSYPELRATKAQLDQLRAREQQLAAGISASEQARNRERNDAQLQQLAAAQRLKALQSEEVALEEKLADLRARYVESYPEVIAAKAQLARIREMQQQMTTDRVAGEKGDSAAVRDAIQKLKQMAAQAESSEARMAKLRNAGVLPASPDVGRGSRQPFANTPISPLDRWWRNSATAQSLGISADQQNRMDDVLQQYRLKLVDVNGTLQKEEIALEPLVGADKLDQSRITAQIDRVAQARAELEKVNGRMLLDIRKQLTSEQWRKLNQLSPNGAKL